VLAAGLGIMITGWRWLDPAVSLAVAVVIFVGTWNLLKESVYLSVQAAPAWVDLDGVRAYLAELPEVEEVHHLHVWALSTSETALTVHLVKPDPARDDELLAQITHELHERFDIDHPTIQWERCAEGYPCRD
jgi:cobalt-zinc-cadmium efflux system protein